METDAPSYSISPSLPDSLAEVYCPDRFRQAAAAFGEELQRYYRESLSGAPALPWREPAALTEAAGRFLDAPGARDDRALLREFLEHAHRLHSPRSQGHQVPPALPLAALWDFAVAATNQGGGLYEMSPFATAAEKAVVARLGARIGWGPGGFAGVATSGGTLANLTAILAARNSVLEKVWEKGVWGERRPVLLVGADAHYSVSRSTGVLGLGAEAVRQVALDSRRRMDPDALRSALLRAREKGERPFAVVATAGSTPVGAFDPLEAIAEVCEEAGVWLHVDGAHGASVLFSRRHRAKVEGIHRCDSLVWDAHKLLCLPALATFVLYRDAARSWAPFAQEAPYLFDPGAEEEYDGARRTMECTRRSLALPLWGVWARHGTRLFESIVDRTFELGRLFYAMLLEDPDFEPVHEPEANIVCFRFRAGRGEPEDLPKLRRRAVRDGRYYLTATRLDGEPVLRVALMHPLAESRDLRGLLENLRHLR